MKARIIGVSLLDERGEMLHSGYERFSIEIDVKRGAAWDAFFNAHVNRTTVDLEFPTTAMQQARE